MEKPLANLRLACLTKINVICIVFFIYLTYRVDAWNSTYFTVYLYAWKDEKWFNLSNQLPLFKPWARTILIMRPWKSSEIPTEFGCLAEISFETHHRGIMTSPNQFQGNLVVNFFARLSPCHFSSLERHPTLDLNVAGSRLTSVALFPYHTLK